MWQFMQDTKSRAEHHNANHIAELHFRHFSGEIRDCLAFRLKHFGRL